jgi:hypothetical protein
VTVPRRGVEDGDTIRTADDCLAVERERLGAQERRGDGDCRVAAAPIVAPPGEQTNLVADAAHLEAIAVVLDLVDPSSPDGTLHAQGGM